MKKYECKYKLQKVIWIKIENQKIMENDNIVNKTSNLNRNKNCFLVDFLKSQKERNDVYLKKE